MRRIDSGLVLVGLIALLCAVLTVPYFVLQAEGHDVALGPVWLWPTVFAAFLLAFVAATILVDHRPRAIAVVVFCVQQALAIASVLLLQGSMGFTAVILVFGAALSCYVLPLWGTAIVVAANVVAIYEHAAPQSIADQVVGAGFYLAIQVVSVLTVRIWRAQERSRSRLAEAHVELSATSALLERSARAEERLRISRDLHDVLGHQLTALALELEIASHRAADPALAHVERARGIAKDLLSDVRRTVSSVRDDDGSLDAVLARVVSGIPRPEVLLSVAPGLSVDGERATALVRATQEVLTNTIRHAPAAENLTIDVSRDAVTGRIVLDAHDDGVAPRDVRPGNGLTGIRERVEALGGRLELERHPGGGLRVRAEVPA
ncbi:sensor histidine kinase [Microbacterium karelineae]|uniref:sensor histidine kinase n=1 Tax=Microbacterium karelineae TaxID=2654283 RepID=UPI0012EA3ADE|nr:histidine kinase [Microbacterium karelineae]